MPRSGGAWRDALGILEMAAAADDPWEVAGLAMRLLAVARTHGLVSGSRINEQPSNQRDREQAEKDAMTEGLDRVRLFFAHRPRRRALQRDPPRYQVCDRSARKDRRAGQSVG